MKRRKKEQTLKPSCYQVLLAQLMMGKHLNAEQVRTFLQESMEGRLSMIEQGAVLIALQTKGVSPQELSAFAKAFQDLMEGGELQRPEAIDVCGTGGSGLNRINTSTLTAIILSSLGVPVAKHGNKAASGRFGSFDLLEKLGVDLDQDEETIARVYDQTQLAFLYARNFHPAMKHFSSLRSELGIPTLFNLIGPLMNPLGAKRQLIGVSNKDQMELVAEACRKLGKEQVIIVCGEDGLDEVTLTGKTFLVELLKGKIIKRSLKPADFGVKACSSNEIEGGTATVNLKIAQEILSGTCKTRHLDLVLVNAALALKLAGKERNLKKAYLIAKQALQSGKSQAHFRIYLQTLKAPSVLLNIAATKRNEVDKRKKKTPLKTFVKKIQPSQRDFRQALLRNGLSLIAEVKQASPSQGKITKDFQPIDQAQKYEELGAHAISVLTDQQFFGGSLKDLEQVAAKTTHTPLLCKDFIVDEYQIYEARKHGADAILLIAALLTEQEMEQFLEIAHSLKMAAICEVHDEEELKKVLKTSADIIGINNRNLHTFEVDLSTTKRLMKMIPSEKLVISESGIAKKADLKALPSGVDAILVGTSLMKSKDLAKSIEQLIGKRMPLVKICGVQTVKEAKHCQKLGIDFIGLNMVPESTRRISYQLAQQICEEIRKSPKSPTRTVAVFRNQSLEEIENVIKLTGVDYVQLSGKEPASFIRKIRVPVIKGVSITSERDVKQAEKLIDVSRYILFDGAEPGSGHAFRHGLARGFKHPFLLAGGINPDNVHAFQQLVQPLGVDVASGVETDGKRDLKKIDQFLDQARS